MMNREAASILALREHSLVDASPDFAPEWAGCIRWTASFCDCADCAAEAKETLRWAIESAYDADDGILRSRAARRQPAPASAPTGRFVHLQFEDLASGGTHWVGRFEGQVEYTIWDKLCQGYGLSDMD